jgi:drug/metabolite transporter (DMT)-like permease
MLLSPFVVRAARRGSLPGRVVRGSLLAGLFYAVHFGAWVWSLALTTVAASVTLVTATPLLLAAAAVVTGRDRPTGRLWAALTLAAVGVTIIGGTDLGRSPTALVGDGLALLGCAGMAGFLLIGRRLGRSLDVLAFAGIATGVAAVVLLGLSAALGVDLRPASGEALFYLVLAALLPQLVGHNLLTWSLRHTTPTVVGLATVGEPVGSTLLGLALLSEVPSPWVLAGCTVTLAAVALALTARRLEPQPPEG